jgi:hypothetical protein
MAISYTSKNHIYGTESKFHVYKTQVKKVKPSSTKTASDKSERKEEKGKEIKTRLGPFCATMKRFGICVARHKAHCKPRERFLIRQCQKLTSFK